VGRWPPSALATVLYMPTTVANGVTLYFELAGSGPRLLVVSGTGGDLRQQPRLTDGPLGEHFEVLTYDQRGLGQSSTPASPSAMADFAADADALLTAVGWDDCLVLGISFGGMVAQEVAIRHRDRVRRLVLACTSAGGSGGASYPLHELAKKIPGEQAAIRMGLIDTRWDAAWQEANPDMVRLIGERFGSASAATPGLTNQLNARAAHDTTDRLGSVACPTLVCGGRFDGIAPPANSEYLARSIPGARLEMFDGGHAFFVQDATAMPAIIEFLARDMAPATTP
jgi:3-oxoadipate enol-lactonase